MELVPVVLFVYNRLRHTQQTISALKENELSGDSELFIFADGAKNDEIRNKVNEVRKYIRNIKGFKSINIIERERNLGLANSVIEGVTRVINEYGNAIILEDDLITAPYFLTFMNKALLKLKSDQRIGSVSGYSFLNYDKLLNKYANENYLSLRHSSWGWGTWSRVWNEIDWEIKDYLHFKKNISQRRNFNLGGDDLSEMLDMQMKGLLDSWSIRFDYNCFKKGLYSMLPVKSMVKNIGFDGSGVHCEESSAYDISLDPFFGQDLNLNSIEPSMLVNKLIKEKFDEGSYKKLKRKLKQLYKNFI